MAVGAERRERELGKNDDVAFSSTAIGIHHESSE
jgi:hypothetical protein